MKSLILCLLFLIAAFFPFPARAADNPYALPDGLYAEVTTPPGIIVGELYYKKVPMTVTSYVGLAEGTLGPKKGTPFFDGLKFFRVDWVIQGGDGGGGAGGRVTSFPDEMIPGLRHDSLGVMQMANGGPDTNGSQWCFMLEPALRLNYLHTVFGHVVRGIELLPKIKVNDTMSVKILRLGPEAMAFKADEKTFADLVAKAKKYDGPRTPGPDAFFDDPDKLLPVGRYQRARDFNFRLAKFQLFTGKTVKARVIAKLPEGLEGAKLNEFMDTLDAKLNMANDGALAIYFVDKDQWVIRIGKDSQRSFIEGPRKPDGTKDPVPATKTYDQALAEFLTQTRKDGDALVAKEEKGATATQPVPDGQKIKLKIDAVLDELIYRLEPAAPK